MGKFMRCIVSGFAVLGMVSIATAQDEAVKPPMVAVGIKLISEYNDNRDGVNDNKEGNLNVAFQPYIELKPRPERWIIDLFYIPSLLWRSNPRETTSSDGQNDTDLYHSLGATFEFDQSETTVLGFGDKLNVTDDPDISSGGTTVRENLSYVYNQIFAETTFDLDRQLGAGLSGNNSIKRFQVDSVADQNDEDKTEASAFLSYDLGEKLLLVGRGSYSSFENANEGATNSADRGAQTTTFTLGFKKIFSPTVYALVEGGFQTAEYDNPLLDTDDVLYSKAEVIVKMAEYSVSGSASYGIYQPYVQPYSSQKRAYAGVSVARKVEDNVTIAANTQFSNGKYDEVAINNPAGNDNMFTAGLSGTLDIDRHLSVSLGYQYENWDSDLRDSFSRNTVTATIKAEL